MKKFILVIFTTILTLLTFSCDPGIEFNPSDWQRKGKYDFTNNYNGFDIEFRGIKGLVGQRNSITEGNIFNREKIAKKLYIEKAILKTNGKEYIGEPNHRNENEIKIIKPNESQHFSIYWDFGNNSLNDVLKEPVELFLVVQNGEKSTQISIPMISSTKLETNDDITTTNRTIIN